MGRVVVELTGLHKTSKILADGSRKDYYYAWAGGPRLLKEYGTDDFVNEFHQAKIARSSVSLKTVGGLVAHYKETELPNCKPNTRLSYTPILDDITRQFGTMPVAAVEEQGSRHEFEEWRDKKKATPRMAGLSWTVLRRVFSYSMQSELLKRNPCLGDSGYKPNSRKEIVWTDAEIATMRARAPTQINQAMTMALETGQRQGDVLKLKWDAYDGRHIKLKQEKTGTRVTILVSAELRMLIEGLEKTAVTILTNSRGLPWTSSGFRASWRKALERAGIEGRTFHDLRGTFITRARKAGSKLQDIAEITGHSEKTVVEILEKHYLASDTDLADAVILNMERAKK